MNDKHPQLSTQQVDLLNLPDVWAGQQRSLLSVDELVQKVFQQLRASGEVDRTLAFYLGDHGYLRGEHGILNKFLWYLPSVRIPLLMRWPGEACTRGSWMIGSWPTSTSLQPSCRRLV